MNCREWEERVALYAGGDAPEDAAKVERHLAECVECRKFAGGLQENLALLREAHEEPLAPAHFAAVRARVMAELERERTPVWRRGWAWGLAATALAVAAFVGWRAENPGSVEPPVVALRYPAAPEVAVVHRRAAAVVAAPGRHRVPTPQKTEQLVIRIVTDDPDVVIYWIADTKGEY